ncbi:uncharacterized protein BXZ73DRAFT_103932 [Epithele typhae]|uniref:uncharacterized protein n=1 Tax=Epithele typhae TaxID=378194 RepID=UPI0020082122|nr:uncharacterized protein BXZ73DRAFT_103932 [Epithele typhae]KAH9923134.1 hypothetical protein BXZ73DRAFT_103932 [Epithele typhae]
MPHPYFKSERQPPQSVVDVNSPRISYAKSPPRLNKNADDEGGVREIRKSARQRGVAAPYIRTSLSPEAQSRAGRRNRAWFLDGLDVTKSSEDEEDDEDEDEPRRSYAKQPWYVSGKRKAPEYFSTETVDDDPQDDKNGTDKTPTMTRRERVEHCDNAFFVRYRGGNSKAPPSLLASMEKLRRGYPAAKVQLYHSKGRHPRHWKVKCSNCDCFIATGPGPVGAIPSVYRHMKSVLHEPASAGKDKGAAARGPGGSSSSSAKTAKSHAERAHAPTGSASASAPASASATAAPVKRSGGAAPPRKRQKLAGEAELDAAARFCAEFGMEVADAERLRRVGLNNEGRMKALGKASEGTLERLMSTLKDAGLDYPGQLLVREGLVQRAAGGP